MRACVCVFVCVCEFVWDLGMRGWSIKNVRAVVVAMVCVCVVCVCEVVMVVIVTAYVCAAGVMM